MKTLATLTTLTTTTTILLLLAVIAGALIWPQMDHRSDFDKSMDSFNKNTCEAWRLMGNRQEYFRMGCKP